MTDEKIQFICIQSLNSFSCTLGVGYSGREINVSKYRLQIIHYKLYWVHDNYTSSTRVKQIELKITTSLKTTFLYLYTHHDHYAVEKLYYFLNFSLDDLCSFNGRLSVQYIYIIHYTKSSPCSYIIIGAYRVKSVCLLPRIVYTPQTINETRCFVCTISHCSFYYYYSFRSILHCWPLIIDMNKLQSYVRLLCVCT